MEIIRHGNKLKTFICDECDCEWKLSPIDIKESNHYAVLCNRGNENNFEKRQEYCWAIKCPECGHIRIRYEETVWNKLDNMSKTHYEYDIDKDKLWQRNYKLPIDF